MRVWGTLLNGIPETEWERRSLGNFSIGLLVRLLTLLLILFVCFSVAKVMGIGGMALVGWTRFAQLYWVMGAGGAVPWFAFQVGAEAWRRRSSRRPTNG